MNDVEEGFAIRVLLDPVEVAALREHRAATCRCSSADGEARTVLEELLDRMAAAVHDPEGSLPVIVVTAMCLACEDEVDPTTRLHVDGDGDFCEHGIVPECSLAIDLSCPCCGRGDIAEVNVGEVWDDVEAAVLRQGIVVLSVVQRSGMDRAGDGWICVGCRTRLRLPEDRAFDLEYG